MSGLKSFAFALSLAAAGLMSAQIAPPRIGFARFGDSTLHPVLGVSSNFIVGDPVLTSVSAASFSNQFGIVAITGHIRLLRSDLTPVADYETPETAPVLGIDGGVTTALAWLPSSQTLLHWNGSVLAPVKVLGLDSPVVSVRLKNAKTAELLLEAPGGIAKASVSLDNGTVVGFRTLPGAHPPAMEQSPYTLWVRNGVLRIEIANGIVQEVPLFAVDVLLERISSDWVQVASRSSNRSWLLHVAPSSLELFELPAPRTATQMSFSSGGAR
jgi:hypothetical protein